ncbi:hypothetical protein TCAL_03657 [Tigriopus californicus]|uniref:GPI transamidase component PIG-S n=1 Tax=Tigriopus californicus TaxID=6832 RepID=A0A553NDM1_TIGCA|nr:GPI transamidase component PIG-S-like [Tigriopus californicus]TRY63540.1 hypothetical protein TCAL_03657 [Tigriopus californicus]|eukprot:TCALIF_03657-PA protein Name:"Similar to PIGS GPI transamidase component PIG-S (Bos taurus)" AED:0.02 eAED:0.02 QI:162/1/0.5/1/1/1/2/0/546
MSRAAPSSAPSASPAPTASSPGTDRKSPLASIGARLSFAVFMAVVGVPIWWKTTQIFRVPLPYERIHTLSETLKVPVAIHLVSMDVRKDHQLGLLLQKAFTEGPPSDVFEFQLQSRAPTQEESKAAQAASSLSALEARMQELHRGWPVGSILVFDVGRDDLVPVETPVILGHSRIVFINRAVAIPDLALALRQTWLGETHTADLIAAIQAPRHDRDRASVLRRVTAARGYDILFSLLLPQPDVTPLTWDVERGLQQYLDPFLHNLRNYSAFSVHSQVLHLTSLNLRPETKGGVHFVTARDCGLAINPVESQLASHVSSNPRLNFLLYVPPMEQSPLVIKKNDHSEEPLESNAFIIPRWGGVAIHNPAPGDTSEIHLGKYMSIFLSQLRLLLGLQSDSQAPNGIVVLPHPSLRSWEYDYLMRSRILENLVLTRLTLQSLSHLLTQISNIVINEDVGERVFKAVNAFEKAQSQLDSGHLEEAFQSSKEAFDASEEAFFDPTLLGLLYFPEDQKYAIYIPLFLPVGIPVLMSLKSVYTFFRDPKVIKVD